MRAFTLALAACAISASAATAEDCVVEDWRWYSPFANTVTVEGVATCETGEIIIRLYEGDGEKPSFLGMDRGYIEGFAFDASFLEVAKPKAPTIKYSIKQE